jgi:hypothetical protein
MTASSSSDLTLTSDKRDGDGSGKVVIGENWFGIARKGIFVHAYEDAPRHAYQSNTITSLSRKDAKKLRKWLKKAGY